MNRSHRLEVACLTLAWGAWALCSTSSRCLAEIKPISRVLPPTDGIQVPAEKRAAISGQLEALQQRLAKYRASRTTGVEAQRQLPADADVYLKAVAYALEFNEFYNDKDVDKAFAALRSAEQRIAELENRKWLWKRQTGTVARGYYSQIDDSPQPYGLVIPEKHDFEKPCPLYVWLHGRGDKQTDLHFLIEREKSNGQIAPPGAIVLHPFGRHCVGFKSAGEIDVLEAIEQVQQDYQIDEKRIVLIGFSMGGAGAWHLGAHYANKWAVVAPGAGFAETAKYTQTDPAKVPDYERALWGVYDVPDYVRNLFNTHVIAYSGELDKQIQAARVMEAAYAQEGQKLEHLIGPGVEHKYEPKTLETLLAKIEEELKNPVTVRPRAMEEIQTRSLRYGKGDHLRIVEAEKAGDDSRISAKRSGGVWQASTKNVQVLELTKPGMFRIDETDLTYSEGGKGGQRGAFFVIRRDGKWQPLEAGESDARGLRKHAGLQGPIDDAFLDPFLVIMPSGNSPHATEQEWIDFELKHFLARWKSLMRGEPRVKLDKHVNAADVNNYHLVVWGTPETNSLLETMRDKLPVKFEPATFQFGSASYDRKTRVPVLVYPNPLNPAKYIVLNSGLTFREAHDKTNSQQNPKLPDWAVIDITQPPDATAPGKIAAAGFFDERWRLK